jgi:hypothetical protein
MMKAAAVGGAAMIAGGAAAQTAGAGSNIAHHVLFWLKRSGSEEDRAALIAGLQDLAKIKEILSLQVGVPASTESRDVVDASFDVSELMMFDSLADQKIYQDHPLHQAFIAKHSNLWRKVVVYDVRTV